MVAHSQILTTILAICPIRAKPDDAAEMTSQLLFGETVTLLRKYKSNWVEIRVDFDGYIGWMDPKQLIKIEASGGTDAICLDIVEPTFADTKSTLITLGATLPSYDGIICRIGNNKFRYSGQAMELTKAKPSSDFIQKLSRKLLNSPYLWGGRSPLGIDCSGLTQIVFKCCGISLLRDAKDQVAQGDVVDFVSTSQVGDLAFFTTSSEKITHVGIIIGDQKIIHASGQVRIDTIDHYGIFNQDIQEYTHRLKIIKRYF